MGRNKKGGGNFSEEKFPPDPLQKTFWARVRDTVAGLIYRCGSAVQGFVRFPIGDPDLRSP